MDALHKTRVADNRVCTCWKVHRAEMTNLAFKHLDMNTLKVVNVMKNWIVNGESQTQPGDDLYDLLWINENKKDKFRFDNLRVTLVSSIFEQWSTENEKWPWTRAKRGLLPKTDRKPKKEKKQCV